MTYETAKKLKDAGFYQGEEGMSAQTMWHPDYLDNGSIPKDLVVYVPTLSELIEACGDGLGVFRINNTESSAWKQSNDPDDPCKWVALDKTPEEAVANLWLALNDKKQQI